ncbi:MAG: hypothetical protein CMF31_05025 [Kordiimonas sp.]|nr:hypothetical protein [Kordiimonas sp.]|tara:strand:- start:41 stop:664 length:624 start_codon:yes stop_codon:yes gene_type:complete
MTREITPAFLAGMAENEVCPVYFCKMEFDSGARNVWSGVGTVSWNGDTWAGIGELGGIGAIEENSDNREDKVTLSLSGVDPDVLASVLDDPIQGRTITIWIGLLDNTYQLIADPIILFGGVMDMLEIQDGKTGTISLHCESWARTDGRNIERRFTPDDQKLEYPDDLGLDYVPQMPDVDLLWGSPGQSGPAVAPSTPVRYGWGGYYW